MANKDPVNESLISSLITQVALAERLGHRDKRGKISTRTLEDWRTKGAGPAYVRLGRRAYYEPDAVDAWIEANRFTGTTEEASS